MQYYLEESFRVYNHRMNSIYQQLNSLKESCSYNEYELLVEGFWDKVKQMASTSGSKLGSLAGKTVNTVKRGAEYVDNLSKDIYRKGVELGKKAVEITKDLYSKVTNYITKAVEEIKKYPGQLWDSITTLYVTISDELGEIYQMAKEKGAEWTEQAKTTTMTIYNNMAFKLSEIFKYMSSWVQKNKDTFKKVVVEKQQEIQEAANTAKQSSFDSVKVIGTWMSVNIQKLKQGTIDFAKSSGYFLLGLLVLPFYASYWAIVKLHDAGKDLSSSMKTGLESLQKNLGETWISFIEGMKASYQQSTQTTVVNDGYKFIITDFGSFSI